MSYDAIPPHLRPPSQVPLAEDLKPPESEPTTIEDEWASVETPQALWQVAKRRWNQGVMPHLEELRLRLGISLGTWLFTVGASYFIAKPLLLNLQQLAPASTIFVQLAPTDALFAVFQVMMLVGSILSSPVILWQFFRFLMPALKPQEKAFLFPALVLACGGGILGVVFAYMAVLPTSLQVLLEFSDGIAEPQMSLLPYVGFCTMMLGVMSLTFQMPLLAFLLGRLNLLKRSFLKKYWRESFIGMLVMSAILTPSQDPFTLILVALALFILYGICLLVTP
ncbi:MAG: twin-arginine translocase subunit TatC [Vampirovibrionales bacterium]